MEMKNGAQVGKIFNCRDLGSFFVEVSFIDLGFTEYHPFTLDWNIHGGSHSVYFVHL